MVAGTGSATARGMRALVSSILLLGAAACGGSQAAPVTPQTATDTEAPSGATMAQPSDDPARLLTQGECESLGQWIADACHARNERSAHVEGWCSDVASRVSAGTWARDCTKNVHYMDAVCFQSSTNPRAMMTCDRAVEH